MLGCLDGARIWGLEGSEGLGRSGGFGLLETTQQPNNPATPQSNNPTTQQQNNQNKNSKITQPTTKMVRKWSQGDPKWNQNWPKMEPTSRNMRWTTQSGYQMAPKTLLPKGGRRFWAIFGFPPEPKNPPKIDFLRPRVLQGTFSYRFLWQMPFFSTF